MKGSSLPLILLLIIFFPRFGHSQELATNINNYTDQLSLLSFKSGITIDPFGILQSWSLSNPFCDWKGVLCNITKQRVTGLNLQHFDLVGTISPHISNLSFLSYINVQNNSFHGILPQEIGKLFRLKFFLLGSNQLEGHIPTSLSLCSKLLYIDLSENKLEGTLPPELGSLSNLQVISFYNNFLTGEIPSSFGNLSSLTNLILSYNSLQGSIPEGICQLPFLINLQLSLNNLVGEIPSSLFNRSSLIMLLLGGNNLSGILPADMFSNLNNLNFFSFGQNQLSGHIPASLSNASQLIRVDLSRNSFTGNIPLLGNLPNIEFLSFDTNKLESSGEGGWDFLTSLSNSTKLQVFSLASNSLSGKLPSSIGNLSRQLYMLLLPDNHLEGYIPEEINKLIGLSMLSLEHNSLTGNIPPSIGTLPNIENLYLNSNKLSGEIPGSLGNFTLLSEMSLRYNFLTGPIPLNLGNFQHVQVLDLSHNMLSGKIPREIFSSSFSKLLDLSWNNLTGPLHEDIGKLKMVQGFDVSSNKLIGEIPISIGDCSNLLYLNFSRNFFQGSIPESLSNLKGVEYVDFSSNNLSGEIPASLGSLQFLLILDLSKNQLQGEVPKNGIFNNVTAVSLGENPQLCGGFSQFKLPACPVNATKKYKGISTLKLAMGLALGLGALMILFMVTLMFLGKRKAKKTAEDAVIEVGVHKFYSHHELKIATRNFSLENWIGEGSFGTVHKGVFRDGTVAAIKVFKLGVHKASKSFLAECEALRSIRHKNLVRTISVCSTDDFKALVLQFMPNGSLEKWLHEGNREKEMRLDMKQRLEIVHDVASSVEYLHHDCETPVVHCDLKPSNVLLDENMCAHVSDFGLARILLSDTNQTASSTLGLKGSIGYIAPEYGIGGGTSTKGDVYSFGILILEMFANKRPTNEIFYEEMDLQTWVSMGLPDRVMEIVDCELLKQEGKSFSSDCIVGILEIGLKCAAKSPEIRPSMREACVMIKNVRTKFLS